MRALLLFTLFSLTAFGAPLEPYRHNFFTTNPSPVVEVVAGTNTSVQYSTAGTDTRRYTVNSLGITNGQAGVVLDGLQLYSSSGNAVITNNSGVMQFDSGTGTKATYADGDWLVTELFATNGITSYGDITLSGTISGDGSGLKNLSAAAMFGTNVTVISNSATPSIKLEAGSANTLVVTNGKAGIGTANPGVALDVLGYVRASAGYFGGYYLDGIGNAIRMDSGVLVSPSIRTPGTLIASNGVYAGAQANTSIAAMNNPLSFFGTLRMTTTNALAIPTDATYFNVTNWNNAITNQFTCNLSTGYLTNAAAGYYSIRATISMIGAASELYEICVLTNGVDSEMVSSKKEFAPSTPRYDSVPVIGRMYLPAGTGISLAVKNTSDNTSLTIHRACLDVGP